MEILKKILKGVAVIITGVILFFVGLFIGYLIAEGTAVITGLYGAMGVLLLIVGVMLSLFLTVIVHESGHLVFGLIAGYRFSSFRIGSLLISRSNGKLKLSAYKIPGFAGQCLMTPPEREVSKVSDVLCHLGGVIMNFAFAGLLLLVYAIIPYTALLCELIVFTAIYSLLLALLNGIPMHTSVPNDGMNTYYIITDKASAITLRNQLLIHSEQTAGKHLSEMPSEWFTVPADAKAANALNTAIRVAATSRTMESMDFALTAKEINELLASDAKMALLHSNLLTCDLIYCRLVTDGSRAEISSLLTVNQQRFMSSAKSMLTVLRTEYAIALIRDKNAEKAENIKQKFEKAAKNYPYKTDANQERLYMSHALALSQSLASEVPND